MTAAGYALAAYDEEPPTWADAPSGAEAPPKVDAPPEEEAQEREPRTYRQFRGWTGRELLGTTFPPLRWIVPDLLPAGLSLLVGAPKVGKSWAALDVALAVAGGTRALGGLPVPDPGDVLYLGLEDGPRRLKDRSRLLGGGETDRLHVYTEWAAGNHAASAAWQWCEDHPDARLVVVDTLARVRPPQTRGGNAYSEDTAAVVPWQHLATHFGIAVVLVHHTRKAGDGGDFISSVSGTHGLAGVADSTLVLDRVRMEDYARLSITGRDVHERELTLRRAGPAWVVHDGPMPDPDLGDTSGRIVAWVATQAGPVGPSVAAQALDLDPESTKRGMARLAEAGRLAKRGRGAYVTPVPTVPFVPSGGDE